MPDTPEHAQKREATRMGCTSFCSEGHSYSHGCALQAQQDEPAPMPPAKGADHVTSAISALTEAHDLIYGQRAQSYGDAREHFTDVAELWSGLIGVEITPEQVAVCLALLKIARIKPHLKPSATQRVPHDSIVDAAGYLGLVEKMQR